MRQEGVEGPNKSATAASNGQVANATQAASTQVKLTTASTPALPALPTSNNDTATVTTRSFISYESKFILDSFLFWVFPARFLRWLAANVNLLPRSHVCSRDLFGFDTVRF